MGIIVMKKQMNGVERCLISDNKTKQRTYSFKSFIRICNCIKSGHEVPANHNPEPI